MCWELSNAPYSYFSKPEPPSHKIHFYNCKSYNVICIEVYNKLVVVAVVVN